MRVALAAAVCLFLMACHSGTTSTEPPEDCEHLASPDSSRTLCVATRALAEGHAGTEYRAVLANTGGTGPLSWSLIAGTLPEGLSLAPDGTLSGTPSVAGTFAFTVQVTDGAQRSQRELSLVLHPALVLSTSDLPAPTEGVTWLAAPDTEVRLAAEGGKPPLTYAAEDLPAGLTLSAETGAFSGAPAPGSAGSHAVTLRLMDAAGGSVSRVLPLEVQPARPIAGGGVAGHAPQGSPLTDTLTVFITSGSQPLPGVGVRIRKNGVEYEPPREALTDAQGRVLFTGLGFNGTTDTVDITANGRNLINQTLVGVNAALVTLSMGSRELLAPRSRTAFAYDTDAQRLILTGGFSNRSAWGCVNDVLELADATTNDWHEAVPPAMQGAMPTRQDGAAAYTGGVMVTFGGIDCMDLSPMPDTWEYRPATRTWTLTASTGPSARSTPVMTQDGSGERVLLFGGIPATSGAPVAELWVYTLATHTWEQRTPSGFIPEARRGAAAVFDTQRGEMVVCGGRGLNKELSDCNAYSPASNTWRALPALPTSRIGFGMAFNPANGEVYVFGGRHGAVGLNDLLVLRNGAWVTLTADGAAGSPSRRESFAFEFDRKSGLLVLVGGSSREGEGGLGDLWTYDVAASRWTRRGEPHSGPRISGTLSAASAPAGSLIYVSATGARFSRIKLVSVIAGAAVYSLPDVPAGEPVSVTAFLVDSSSGQSVVRSYVDVEVGPLTQDTALDITLPAGPLPVRSTTFSFALPETWSSVDSLFGVPYEKRSGLAQRYNGSSTADVAARSIQYSTVPVASDAVQRFYAGLTSSTPEACEQVLLYWEGERTEPIHVPSGPRNVSPGTSICSKTEPGDVTEETYSFTLPAGTGLWQLSRGSFNMLTDWVVYGPGSTAPMAFRFPEPSTLAPSRPAPKGQRVGWDVDAALFTSSGFRYDDFSLSNLSRDAWAGTQPYGYVRR